MALGGFKPLKRCLTPCLVTPISSMNLFKKITVTVIVVSSFSTPQLPVFELFNWALQVCTLFLAQKVSLYTERN